MVKLENRKISSCISVTRPLRLFGNLKESVDSGGNHFYLCLLIDRDYPVYTLAKVNAQH